MDEISTAATNGHGLPTPVIVIGASAGGVQALKILLAGIPANFPAAICIVTHLSAHTPSQMAAILQPCPTFRSTTPSTVRCSNPVTSTRRSRTGI